MTARAVVARFGILVIALGVGASSVTAHAQGVTPTSSRAPEIRAEPEIQPPSPEVKSSAAKVRKAKPERIFRVALAPALPEDLAQGLAPPGKLGAPLQIGLARPVESLRSEEALGTALDWEALAEGGRIGAFSVTSPEAAATRVGLRVIAIPSAAVLRFYAPSGEETFEVTGAEVLDTIARNLEAGDHGAEARTYWSPVIEDSTLVVEIELPDGARPQDLRLAAPVMSHLVTSARTGLSISKAAAYCEIDVMCYQGAWGAQSNAEARILFTSGGSTYVCSGTLVADKDTSTFIPYFLTANHCVGFQTVASTIVSYWFYRSTVCNSGVPGAYKTLTGGATLLYATTATDTSFMRLNATPPAGVAYAGWAVGSTLASGTAVTGVHHPGGDLQKITFGNVDGYYACSAPTNGSFTCNSASASSATFYGTGWNSGITEPGSSGSALYQNNGQYLVGQLYGGSSSCTGGGGDFYGRFDVAYNAALSQWLGVTAPTGGTPQVGLSPASVNFGGESMGTTSPSFALGVTNAGTGTLAISGVSLPSGQFTQTNNCGSLAAGSGCTINLIFNPAPAAVPLGSTVLVVATLAITSNAAGSPTTASVFGTAEKSLVTHFYRAILGRSPDSAGKAFWEGEALRMQSLGADVNETWYAMAMAFFSSSEYAARNRDDTGFVTDLYRTFFNRAPDATGLSSWTGQLAAGQSREVVLASFMFSAEFANFTQSIFGVAAQRAEVGAVMDFYRGLLSRLPESTGFANWVQQFRAAQCQGAGAVYAQADSISKAFLASPEYAGRNRTNSQYVGDLYNAFLRRGGDLAGVRFWIGQLDTAAMSRETVRQNFFASAEFAGRVNAIVAQGCLP